MQETPPVAVLEKNSRERIHVALSAFKGFDLIDVRTFFNAGAGEYRPTQKGVSLKLAQLPALIRALQKAEGEARRLGLLAGDR